MERAWNTPCSHTNPLDTWQFKTRLLRKKLKGWAINTNVEIKKEKAKLINQYDVFDGKYERGDLTEANERQVMLETMEKLEGLWKMEEIKARQRARERCEGGRQKHCLLPGSGQSKKQKKKTINSLEGPQGVVESFRFLQNLVWP